ncbi:trafficking protein particle complex subunit 3 [Anaeramoeba flamelloides]|uniref:Trafficking protein particle complex subunit n=1 Tax=Anaeramoeba flamelloides TaxID=1746091 RepID=A0AAV7Z8U6_9EUKA|nr:trafficking protein particle complex subunit [Anaeramoeba flamelloides]KAJ6233572.1 trafficking protein particle complex subunit 3 [Anaeramoeba flamelloides]
MSKLYSKLGESAWAKVDKINSEIFTLTYGEVVNSLIQDYETSEEVNVQLDEMGYSIGIRMIDEFLAISEVEQCKSFRDTGEILAKVACKMYLGVDAVCKYWTEDDSAFTLELKKNPFVDFVELPQKYKDLWYCNIICGIIRGSLDTLQIAVDVKYQKCVLRGHNTNEIRVTLKSSNKENSSNKN